MSAVAFEQGELTPSELEPLAASEQFENVAPVPEELRKKFSLNVTDLGDGSKPKK